MPAIQPTRGLIRRPRGPFAFPGTKPGVDPSYGGLLFSVVPNGANFNSLLQGGRAGVVTAPTVAPVAAIGAAGPAVKFPANASDNLCRITFAGNSSTNFGSSTIAAIFTFNGIATTQTIFANDSVGAGVSLNVTGAGLLQWTMFGVSAKSSSITLAANIPYLVVASQNGTTAIDFFVMRLDTGVIASSSATGATPGAPSGTFTVGSGPGGGSTSNANISAVAFLSGYNAQAVVRKWASDPWGLWYPR